LLQPVDRRLLQTAHCSELGLCRIFVAEFQQDLRPKIVNGRALGIDGSSRIQGFQRLSVSMVFLIELCQPIPRCPQLLVSLQGLFKVVSRFGVLL